MIQQTNACKKLPGTLGANIHKAWKDAFGNIEGTGIGPSVTFVYKYLKEKCTEEMANQEVKRQSYAFCSKAIFTPQAYGYKPKGKRYFRKSKYYKYNKKPQKGHHYSKPRKRNCACFICGEESHLANKCPRKNENIKRANLVEETREENLKEAETDDESVYSLLEEGENDI